MNQFFHNSLSKEKIIYFYMLSEDEYLLIGLFMIPVLIFICVCAVIIRRMLNLEEPELEHLLAQP